MLKKPIWIIKLFLLCLLLLSELFCGVISLYWFWEGFFQVFPTELKVLRVGLLVAGLVFSGFCLFCFIWLEEKR